MTSIKVSGKTNKNRYCSIKSCYFVTVHSSGVGVLHQIFRYQGSARKQNWTQSDLRFCENEWSKRFKINEKGGQLDRKLREN